MKLKLIKKQDEAKGTKSFFWEPEKEVKYLAGQYYYFTIPKLNYPDPRGNTRHFTLSSSPTEGKLLRNTTRIREESGYKKTLDELPIDSVIDGEGPNGTFVLDESSKDQNIFIAGGIGITPFRSIIKHTIDKNLSVPIYLIYSNSVPEEIAFRDELTEWLGSHPNIKIEMTVSKPEESKEKWTGLTGRIDENLLRSLIENWKLVIGNLTWWLCGPPGLVDAMQLVLGKLNIPFARVRSEKFTGY